MTIRRFTDADRQDIRDAAEERRVLDELYRKDWARTISSEETDERIAYHWEIMGTLQIDPYRRS
ncbi:hypothetical protein [Geodermatophilus obscurus]|uniref:Uncharacterized protein n=1 Tax=Geodermatophilus obscurus (strain ATCC 25078 / DSM 43160 / JCM 3152 / CCUG 61914 / KCC A-0152 / KCTC 9177 / NBRC 13315 / NRRL B-3577 / G-20) TaxID=526225 RepID=D2SC55_GEOOG|nr:hypothetical protein [Geodermatophilus obscurus]ADB74223.1 hypothetical protein Gobs_1494 [Geodermatophilus obscurus DSM 43160]